jgi:hypothetical protein
MSTELEIIVGLAAFVYMARTLDIWIGELIRAQNERRRQSVRYPSLRSKHRATGT